METTLQQMKDLVKKLNQAAKAYYQEDREIMDDREYDALYSKLEQMEKETGIVLANSPTVNVGYEAVDALPKKETHRSPILSLDKTKDREALREFIGEHKTLLSWKMDGLTIVLTYENGQLQKAVTRGNGIVGEVITNNARVFKNIPLKIAYTALVLRGEAVITYSDFERINNSLEDVDARYKNPRNLCSGSVRQLNNQITAKETSGFMPFPLVSAQDEDMHNSREYQMEWLRSQGFEVVEYRTVTGSTLDAAMDYFSKRSTNDFPSDGLVALYDDIHTGDSLAPQPNFQEMPLLLNGRMKSVKPL